MKIHIALTGALVLLLGAVGWGAQAPPSRVWAPAVYHALVVGQSDREDVLKALGKPTSVGKEQDTGVPIMNYMVSDPVPGTLVVYFRHNILDGMTLFPTQPYTKREIISVLGPDYLMVRYAVDECLNDGGAAPLYESTDGKIEHLEYRPRGLAVILSGDQVQAIGFSAKSYGPTHSRCVDKKKRKAQEP